MKLQIEKVSWGVDGKPIIQDVCVTASEGEFVGIVGPNGSGKSSLLRCVYRVLKPDAGLITLDDENVWNVGARESARRTAVVLQEMPAEFDFTVHEIVSMGRSPHKGAFDRETDEDSRIVTESLHTVGLEDYRARSFRTLSGGEKQRALIARALAQKTRFLVLDEPTNHLDVRYQMEIMDIIRGVGITTIAAIHDLNLAASYCDYIFVIDNGKIVADGSPTEVLTTELLADVFGVGAVIDDNPVTGKPRVTFYPSTSTYGSSDSLIEGKIEAAD